MRLKEIVKDGKRYGILAKNKNFPDGLHFYTKDTDFIQVGTWNYNKCQMLKAHSHKVYKRESDITQELVFVKSGSLMVRIFDDNADGFFQEILNQGDFLILFSGGHSYEILENNTEVLEVKNGPYPGLENDKRILPNQ